MHLLPDFLALLCPIVKANIHLCFPRASPLLKPRLPLTLVLKKKHKAAATHLVLALDLRHGVWICGRRLLLLQC